MRWKPFNFVVGEVPANIKWLKCILDLSNSPKPHALYVQNFGGRSISCSEVIEASLRGPPGRRRENKARSEQG